MWRVASMMAASAVRPDTVDFVLTHRVISPCLPPATLTHLLPPPLHRPPARREVLVMVMRKHQRYFPVVDAQGDLLPCFITVRPQLHACSCSPPLRSLSRPGRCLSACVWVCAGAAAPSRCAPPLAWSNHRPPPLAWSNPRPPPLAWSNHRPPPLAWSNHRPPSCTCTRLLGH